jgi:hypothetical protein
MAFLVKYLAAVKLKYLIPLTFGILFSKETKQCLKTDLF